MNNMRVVYVIDMVNEVVPTLPIEKICVVETLTAVFINFDRCHNLRLSSSQTRALRTTSDTN